MISSIDFYFYTISRNNGEYGRIYDGFVVSGSMVHISLQAHKCLLSDFIKNVELQLGTATAGVGRMDNACPHSQVQSTHGILKIHKGSKLEQKKKVCFADNVVEPSSNNEEY
ncbi:hypothetical protein MKX03_032549 [Papaver bracteatum]|nr:hypothetical protein MKX03_032549 [Papaver bracteatum]